MSIVAQLLLCVGFYAVMADVTGFVLGLTICRNRDGDKMPEYVFSLLWPITWIFFISEYIETTVGEWLREHPNASKRMIHAASALHPVEMGRRVADWLDNRRKGKRKNGSNGSK